VGGGGYKMMREIKRGEKEKKNTWSRTCHVEARRDFEERGWSSEG
jgi:hypothetical protein